VDEASSGHAVACGKQCSSGCEWQQIKMAKFIIGLLIGAVIGGVLIFYFFVGVPRAVPGQAVKPPEASGVPAGTAQIVLRQDFFNSVFSTIFTQMKAPAFQLSTSGGEQCSGELILIPEGSG